MSNLSILLKNALINNLGLNSFSKGVNDSREKKKLLFTSIMMVFAILFIGFLSTTYSLALADGLESLGYLDLLIIIAIIVCSLIVFFYINL